ncbi:MAG: alpha/beta fold hydrolase [Candidatus Doudnabacteria bacterium]|nr:alpha/beta fold hydrolase [Candidatus Doudnabacteria bacterium]
MKEFIKNRSGQKIAVVVEKLQDKPQGLAFVVHGLGGFKENLLTRAMAESFIQNDYITVTFDAGHSIGESEGNYEKATVTSHYCDLEDVINWAMRQPWFRSPFVLVGHSLGGIATALYAECYASQVKALAPIATLISGR